METDTSNVRIAVLIDADNTSPKYAEALLDELAKYGTPTIKRAYGDWTSPRLSGWTRELNLRAIRGMHQNAFTSGKNSTDSALIIDAMDLLYAGNVEAFALVTSDSDFTSLALRLRESGKVVYGLGRKRTPVSLQNACDKFIALEVLGEPPTPSPTGTPSGPRGRDRCRGGGRGAAHQPAERVDARRSTPPPTTRAGRASATWAATSAAPRPASTRATSATPSSARWSTPSPTSRSRSRVALKVRLKGQQGPSHEEGPGQEGSRARPHDQAPDEARHQEVSRQEGRTEQTPDPAEELTAGSQPRRAPTVATADSSWTRRTAAELPYRCPVAALALPGLHELGQPRELVGVGARG